jgi:hypothetical protein
MKLLFCRDVATIESMAKTDAIGTRLEPDEFNALRRAAAADDRPVTALIRRIIAEWLRTNGWLDPPAPAPKAGKPTPKAKK